MIVAYHEIEKEAVSTGITASAYKNLKIKIVRPEYRHCIKTPCRLSSGLHRWSAPVERKIDRKLVRKMAEELYLGQQAQTKPTATKILRK